MIAALSLENMLAWFVQVSVIAGLGALLPALLRIRHPKSQLAHYHVILLLCLILPFAQPLQHPLVMVSSSFVRTQSVAPRIPWPEVALAAAGLGVVVRLLWLAMGLWQLRRLRKSAVPIGSLPRAIREAKMLTGTEAGFCISKQVAGPATLGFLDPVVLLPSSFLSLNEDAQRSIACHELMHVRRHDWLVTLLEEAAGSLLWFHPAIWFLLAKMKLAREQVVDAEVVRVNAPGPYIEALLSMAVVSKPRLALPAAPFFTDGHLAHRMRLLLASPRRSLLRLCVSYGCMAAALAATLWAVLILFPLNGDAHVVSAAILAPRRTIRIATTERRLFLPPLDANKFQVKLPEPATAPRDVFYFVNVQATDPIPGHEEGMMPPPPPPPPPPGALFPMAIGVRRLPPGTVATPEQVQSFIDSFPRQSFVEVIQGEDGTVQRVMVTRRPEDETHFRTFGARIFGSPVGPATAAEPADGLH